MSPSPKLKKAISTSLCILACLQMASCKVVTNKGINNHFEDFKATLQVAPKSSLNDGKLVMANDLQFKAERIAHLINKAPKLETWTDSKRTFGANDRTRRVRTVEKYEESKAKIKKWMSDVKKLTMDIHAITYEAGKNSYKKNQFNRLENSPEQIAQNEVLALYSLTYLRNLSEGYAKRSINYIEKLSSKNMKRFSENDEEFKLEVLQQHMAYIGMMKIIDKDAEKTLKKLKAMRDHNILPEAISENINNLLNSGKQENSEKIQKFNEYKKEALTKEQQEEFDKALASFDSTFGKKSLLFDPANPDHPLMHLFVIASNLSWGLINTMIGGAFVATKVLLVPVSRGVNLFLSFLETVTPYRYMRMINFDLPRLAISASKMQIYADVCGLGYIPSKMSAGLFELDFCTGHRFASGHEAGHAKQSALLGPFYFPAAILSYALVGGHGGFIEAWADIWAAHYH
ncbi:hypothetical protein BALOs_2300 [Halobacteriovorax sp. BALOs_7]|uniref:Lipoprotein n=1 Tax=Halobacteriovorax vibrionivorans TaxID=2152716 RepID=A0ABY0IIT8_9BACT|nr:MULTISPECIES: hypothetical protein [Halobacteriovorax]AYF45298.1 hypothetical protein BALOs_2300 [Halobacteriovorax sp. BALOs_7]RZF22385.1 hypothetical protein DAY19_01035 [Halobacteriovorax vibrionivorans]TGD48637.1 hypothetical protein EP118_03950 [Halobacteriovorax sp. Y22]